MTTEDRQRLHELLDWALDHDEDYAIMRFANVSLDYQLHIQEYRLRFKKYESKDQQKQLPD